MNGGTKPREVVVTAAVRTPFGRFGGVLAEYGTPRLGAFAIDRVLDRAGVPADAIDSVYAGVGMIAGGQLTPARQMVLQSALPPTTPSLTVDRACCSGLTALALGYRDIAFGLADCVIGGGAECLSATPRLAARRSESRPGPQTLDDPLTLRAPFLSKGIATYTGEEAVRHGIAREEQDAWAVRSHEHYFAAEERGFFDVERSAMDLDGKPAFTADEGPRRDCTHERLAALQTVYGSPSVTAGNAPGLNDGAAFLVLAARDFAEERGLPVLAVVRGHTQVAGDATSGSYMPAIAVRRLLDRHGLGIDDMALVEINEAFAATPLVSALHLAELDRDRAARLQRRININGGAVAIGHPLGASGARIVMTLIAALRERGGGLGVAAICGGFGQGDAMLVEVPS